MRSCSVSSLVCIHFTRDLINFTFYRTFLSQQTIPNDFSAKFCFVEEALSKLNDSSDNDTKPNNLSGKCSGMCSSKCSGKCSGICVEVCVAVSVAVCVEANVEESSVVSVAVSIA